MFLRDLINEFQDLSFAPSQVTEDVEETDKHNALEHECQGSIQRRNVNS